MYGYDFNSLMNLQVSKHGTGNQVFFAAIRSPLDACDFHARLSDDYKS